MNSYRLYALILVLLVLVFYLLILVYRQYRKNRKQRKRMALGKKLEQKAERILMRKGFKKIAYQKPYSYTLKVDGKKHTIKVIPDFTATKRGRFCVIEVKSGKSAPSIYNENTRRQLLEYDYALSPYTTYLLDMENEVLKEIKF